MEPNLSEKERLRAHHEHKANWKKWGPYLSERSWGTVREDYSDDGDAWNYFPHDHSRSRVYRWNEDGIGGISDRHQHICFAWAFWNGKDPILKERMFGLANEEGNHGEDVKEMYFYLDNIPSHSFMKMLYKYPQAEFPYKQLVDENAKRGLDQPEYELLDTGIFQENRYFDLYIEYAKVDQEDICIKLTAVNRGPDPAYCALLPTIWFRNTWIWGYRTLKPGEQLVKPHIKALSPAALQVSHPKAGNFYLYAAETPHWIFTENETNFEKLYGRQNNTPYVKDAFHRYLIEKESAAVNPAQTGTKAAGVYERTLQPNESFTIRLRLTNRELNDPFAEFDATFEKRIQEANEFYSHFKNPQLSPDELNIQRQACAGMLWSKQLYNYDFQQWLKGDNHPYSVPVNRKKVNSKGWEHLVNFDIISMPDKWEYPWYACWDLTFHAIGLVLLDPDFAKRQLTLITREWYMHPNGQLPAYEWNFNDVNPPTIAWAAYRVYKIDEKQNGKADRKFLEGIFHKLLLNFTWWVNRLDREGNNIFQGGFLGLDNISIFDRSNPIFKGRIDQADGTAWMSFYCILLMKIALELAQEDPVYQDSATKFFEHFLRIAHALHDCGKRGHSLWNEEDGFFYDAMHLEDGRIIPLKVRSLVGLLPLFAVETIEPEIMKTMPTFEARVEWFTHRRPEYTRTMASVDQPGLGKRRLLSILDKEHLKSLLRYMLDEKEFLSEYGIRSLSKYYQDHPYQLELNGSSYTLNYQPGDSQSKLYGGNSNWRGPIWMPLNFLIIESLQKFHHYYGDDFKVEFPTGSGRLMHLKDIATELSIRLTKLFCRNEKGLRPMYDPNSPFQHDPHWKNLILFHEFFHGDTGLGLGASHQTGWTALVAKFIQQLGNIRSEG